MKLHGLVLILVATLATLGTQKHVAPSRTIQGPQQAPQLPGISIVDETSIPSKDALTMTRLILGVDKDDYVRMYRWYEESGKPPTKPVVCRYLGQRIRESGGLPLARLLPKKEVPVLAYRVTRTSFLRYHVVLTWGFDKYEPSVNPNPSYNLYVIEEDPRTRRARVVHTEEQAGGELKQFLVLDMSGNGQVEIIDVSLDGETELGSIRVLNPDGTLKLLQSFDGSQVHFTSEDDAVLNGYHLWVQQKNYGCVKEREACFTEKTYQWSLEKSLFVPWEPPKNNSTDTAKH